MRERLSLAALLILLAGPSVSCTLEPRSSVSRVGPEVTDASPQLQWTMQKWRQAREEAQAALLAPRREVRITRLQEFLEKYPDYPESDLVLQRMVDAIIQRDGESLDFAQLDRLLNRMADRESEFYSADTLLTLYYLRRGFPPGMSERFAARIREDLARKRTALDAETDPAVRRESLWELKSREVGTAIAEGRILLAKYEYSAAIRRLLEAESADAGNGLTSISLVDHRGAIRVSLPSGTDVSDWLNLALATAYARTGSRERALDRLERVHNFRAKSHPEVTEGIEALQRELAVPARELRVVRSEPQPAPDFRFKDLQGKEAGLSDFKGRVVLLMFWSSW